MAADLGLFLKFDVFPVFRINIIISETNVEKTGHLEKFDIFFIIIIGDDDKK